jgi:hypothetical protein
MLGSELRRQEQRYSRARMRVDRDGIVDGVSEGFLRILPPLAPARPESHMFKGQEGPSQQAQADQLGGQCPRKSWSRLHIMEISDDCVNIFIFTIVSLAMYMSRMFHNRDV